MAKAIAEVDLEVDDNPTRTSEDDDSDQVLGDSDPGVSVRTETAGQPILSYLEIIADLIKAQLRIMDTHKAPGEDNISPDFLKRHGDSLMPGLVTMFTRVLRERFPTVWKTAVEVQKHDRSNVKN